MILRKSLSYNQLKELYNDYFSLGNLNTDINTKFALISLTCYLLKKLQEQKPDITAYKVLRKINDDLSEEFIKGLAVVVEDFYYNCKEFPTFGIEPKKMPAKIKEILDSYIPF